MVSNIYNVEFIKVKVLLEGIEVPYSSVSVSYGTNVSIPTCTISIPACSALRSIPENTKVLVLYQDPVNYTRDTDDWCVMFDGEVESFSYSSNNTGAVLTLNVIHSVSFLAQLQLFLQEAVCPVDLAGKMQENGTLVASLAGASSANRSILSTIFRSDKNTSSNFETMSDLIYVLLKTILNIKIFLSPVSKWFQRKLLDEIKIDERLSMVTESKRATLDSIADESAANK